MIASPVPWSRRADSNRPDRKCEVSAPLLAVRRSAHLRSGI